MKAKSIKRASLRNEYDCGCVILHDGGGVYVIDYCPKHAAAPEMYEALKEALDMLKGDGDYEILKRHITQALAKAKGK